MTSYLLGAATLLLIFFCIRLLLFASETRQLNTCLGLILLARSLVNLLFIAIDSGQIVYFPVLLKVVTPLYYATPVLFYIYIRGVVTGRLQLLKNDRIHLIPLLIGILDIIPWLLKGTERWSEDALHAVENNTFLFVHFTGEISSFFAFTLKPTIHIIYTLWVIRLVHIHGFFNLKGGHAKSKQLWIGILIVFPFLLQVVELYQSSFFWFDSTSAIGITYLMPTIVFAKTLGLLLILLIIFQFPSIVVNHLLGYNNYLSPSINTNSQTTQKGSLSNLTGKSSLETKLNSVQASKVVQLVSGVMLEKKLFLIPDLHISEVSAEMKIPVHHLSLALNQYLGVNFRDWINEYRINYFIELYKDSYKLKTVEALALESGFKSVATFYNAFKKVTRVSPTVYFNKLKSN